MTPAESLHLAACRALRIAPGHGSQAAVADALGVSRSQYHDTVSGRKPATLDLLAGWAARLGMVVVVTPDGGASFAASPLDCAREAICMVQRIGVLLGEDHPTAEAETAWVLHGLRGVERWLDVPEVGDGR